MASHHVGMLRRPLRQRKLATVAAGSVLILWGLGESASVGITLSLTILQPLRVKGTRISW